VKLVTVCTSAVLLALAAGCGSSSSSGTGASSPPTSSASSAAVAASSQLRLAGTITESGGGTTIEVGYKVGPIQYKPPPQAVLSGCNITDPATISQTAYSAGELVIAYLQGSLDQQLNLLTDQMVSGGNWQGVVAIDLNGQWQCQQDYGPILLDVPPHSVDRYPIWILSQVLTNQQPTVSTAEADSWQFSSLGFTFTGMVYPTTTTSGPNAGNCGGTDILMVYAHLPFTVPDPSSGQPVSCQPV